MNYCTECGHQLKEDQDFCTDCGTKQDAIQPPVAASNTVSEMEQTKVPQRTQKKPIAKKTKWLVSIAATFIIILFGVHLFLSSHFDPVKDFQAMDQAIVANDVETFMSFIEFDESALLDEGSYFNFIKTEWDAVKDQYIHFLEKEVESDFQLSQTILSSDSAKLFEIQQNDKLILYKTHSFIAAPTQLIASTNIDNTEITINDITEMLENTEPHDITQIYPGKYAVNASADSIFGELTYDNEIEVYPREQMEIVIEFDGSTYSFNTNQEDAYLFVNGESTGKKFSELEFLGPVPEENHDTLEMHGEWDDADGEVIKSEILTFNKIGSYGMEFYFNETETAEEDLETETDSASTNSEDAGEDLETETVSASTNSEDTGEDLETETVSASTNSEDTGDIVLDFRAAYETALNTKDFSLIQPYLNSDSTAYEELRIYIGDLEDTDYNYSFGGNEIVDVKKINDGKFEVTTNEVFTFTNHLDEQIDYDRIKKYTLVQVDGSFQITHIDYVETNRDYD